MAAAAAAAQALEAAESLHKQGLEQHRHSLHQIEEAEALVNSILGQLQHSAGAQAAASFIQLDEHLTAAGLHAERTELQLTLGGAMSKEELQAMSLLQAGSFEPHTAEELEAEVEREARELVEQAARGATGAAEHPVAAPAAAPHAASADVDVDAGRIVELVTRLLHRLQAAREREEASAHEAARTFEEVRRWRTCMHACCACARGG